MQVTSMPIDQVVPYEDNPRNNEDAIQATANSIKEFGWQQPLVVDKEKTIIVGHTRLAAAKELGMKEVPVVVADNLSDDQVKAYRLVDNKTGELSDWDFSQLNDEIADIDLDLSDFGFRPDEIDIADGWEDGGGLDDYEEPKPQEESKYICPHCGYTAKESEFKP